MILSYFPILAVDVLGSIGMILFAVLSLLNAKKLKAKEPDNVIFLYLVWICSGLTVFALSRSFGHIFRQILILAGHREVWASISPYSGTINTVSFMIVGSITLFFNQNWKINMKILSNEKALKDAHIKLITLNQTLEQKVVERTEQIIQADKLAALGELSAGVAHEINNPLGVILGYTQLMLKDPSIKENHAHIHDDLKVIERHVKNCKSVVSDMLTFSRKRSLKQGLIDINQVVNDVVNFLHNHSDFKKVEMKFSIKKEPPLIVMGNEQEFRQVVINLLINACHAVDKQGMIHVSASLNAQEEVEVRVKDNGRGISRENITKIFDPFFTTKPVGQGTGLGLSVSYGIIKKYGGRIDVKSLENQGALFKVILPLAKEH